MIISVDIEKVLEKIQNLFIIKKNFQHSGNIENLL